MDETTIDVGALRIRNPVIEVRVDGVKVITGGEVISVDLFKCFPFTITVPAPEGD